MKIVSSDREHAPARQAVAQARRQGWCLTTAESCSAGMIAALLSRIEGAGTCLHGGIVSYSKDMKHAVLGVPSKLLAEKSAVCAEVAQAMARGAAMRTPADAAIAITGVAEPDSDEDGNPVGLVFVAVATPHETAVRRLDLGNRSPDEILSEAICGALELFLEKSGGGRPNRGPSPNH
jgi:PncC family amidohydrolase